jgi:hypothetical protein
MGGKIEGKKGWHWSLVIGHWEKGEKDEGWKLRRGEVWKIREEEKSNRAFLLVCVFPGLC